MRMKQRLPTIAAWLLIAFATYYASIWALPRVMMQRVHKVAAPADAPSGAPPANTASTATDINKGNLAVFPAMTSHNSRQVVMPSPDLLYAICSLDLSQRPARIQAHPVKAPAYWSIALYAANSDNFFAINDRQAAGQPINILLTAPGQAQPGGTPGNAKTIQAPSQRVLLLMRVLATDYAKDKEALEAARRSLRCEPA
jgi:uncharacterized membrane protein